MPWSLAFRPACSSSKAAIKRQQPCSERPWRSWFTPWDHGIQIPSHWKALWRRHLNSNLAIDFNFKAVRLGEMLLLKRIVDVWILVALLFLPLVNPCNTFWICYLLEPDWKVLSEFIKHQAANLFPNTKRRTCGLIPLGSNWPQLHHWFAQDAHLGLTRMTGSRLRAEESCRLTCEFCCRFPLDCRCFGAAGWRVSWDVGMSDGSHKLEIWKASVASSRYVDMSLGYVKWL